MKKILLFITNMLCILLSLHAQWSATYNIKGIVRDTVSRQPLEGSTIILQKSKASVLTNAKGYFIITLSIPSDTLVISHIGYQTKHMAINRNDNASLTIQLVPITTHLQEVVVSTGYQSLPAERATGSFTKIDNATLNQQVGSNVLARLKGVASSILFPNQNLAGIPKLMIRGLSTINGPKGPLIVVDNFPYEGDIDNINPNDVESITILKDAAAASIWGARAGNGVIVVTTKRGSYNKPLQVHFNTNLTVTGKPDLQSLRIISPSDYIDIEQFLFDQGYYDAFLDNTYSYPALSPVVEILAKRRAGLISDADVTAQIDVYRNSDIRDEFSKYFFQNAIAQQYAISLQGGGKYFSYFLSGGYDKSISNLSSQNDRYTLRSQNSFTPVKNLEVKLGLQYVQSGTISGKPSFGTITVGGVAIPYLRFADANGDPLPVDKALRSIYTDTVGEGKLLNWKYYPLTDWKHQTGSGKQQDFTANAAISYNLPAGFSLDFKYQYERQMQEIRSLSDINSYNARNLINRFTQLDRTTGMAKYIVPLGGILHLSKGALEVQNLRGQISFDRTFNMHRINAFVGAETRQAHSIGNSSTYYGYDGNTLTTANIDFTNSYPTFINGNYSTIPGLQGSLTDKLNRYVSVYGNAAYTFKKKYIVSGSARKDASNLYGVTSNNKWNLLWSGGIGWVISNERFYNSHWLSYLKFRATYGFGGNTDPNRTALLTFRQTSANTGFPGNHDISRLVNLPNPGLHWEKVRTINVGVDFQIKSQIMRGSIEAYFKKGMDLYGPDPQDPTLGLGLRSVIIKNVANMEGKGMDIVLNSKIINSKFKWDSHLIFSYNASKTTKYYLDTSLLSASLLNSGSRLSPLPGKPVYSIIALKWAGLNTDGDPQGYFDGKISTDYANIYNDTRREDLVYKPVLPRYFGSLINDFTYSRFSLAVCIYYRLGYYFTKPALTYSQLFSNGSIVGTSDYAERWQKPGDEKTTNVPAMLYPANNYRDFFYSSSEANVLKADNVKLQYVNLSCSFNKADCQLLPFKQIELYVNASNLGIIWKANKAGIDPDFITSPVTGKTYAIGVRVNF